MLKSEGSKLELITLNRSVSPEQYCERMMDQLREFYSDDPNSNGCSETSTAKRMGMVSRYLLEYLDGSWLDFGSGPAKLLDTIQPPNYTAVDARPNVVDGLLDRDIDAYTEVPEGERYDVVLALGACSEHTDPLTSVDTMILRGLNTFKALWDQTDKAMIVNVPRRETDIKADKLLVKYSMYQMYKLLTMCEPRTFDLNCHELPHQYFLVMYR